MEGFLEEATFKWSLDKEKRFLDKISGRGMAYGQI